MENETEITRLEDGTVVKTAVERVILDSYGPDQAEKAARELEEARAEIANIEASKEARLEILRAKVSELETIRGMLEPNN